MLDLKYVRSQAGNLVEQFPSLWRNLQVFRFRKHPFLRKIVTPGHDIVIEGYPRSANSFAVRAFLFTNGWQGVKVATHTHCAAQVVLATNWNIPTLVLIRKPDEAVISHLALGVENGYLCLNKMSKQEKHKWARYYTDEYCRFYRALLPLFDKYVLADFEETTKDFDHIIKKINTKFQTQWAEFEHTEESVQKIFKSSKKHLSPNLNRQKIKEDIKEIYFSKENSYYCREANSIYREMIELQARTTGQKQGLVIAQ